MDARHNHTDRLADLMKMPTPTPNATHPDGDNNTTENNNKTISYGVIGFVIFVIVLVVVFILRRKCAHKQRRRSSSCGSDSSAAEETSGAAQLTEVKVVHGKELDDVIIWGDQFGENIRELMKGYIVDAKNLILDQIIGKGQFGCVYMGSLSKGKRTSNNYGQLTHQKVAVKTLKGGSNIEPDKVEAFLSEGMIMKDFSHPNVLTLIGVAIGEQGIPMIILPYMENGNLKKYIQDIHKTLVVRELLEFGRQVACGMTYLADHKFVHRDLAARNCMLDAELTVKVADFGLSRDIYTREYYCSEDKQAKLPVKWMAPESLSTSKYTYKTDVWSYGVLLWELMTRGATPYPDVSNWEVWRYIKSGRRMRQPESCPEEIYKLMLACWHESSAQRPSFSKLARELDAILDRSGDTSPEQEEPYYINLTQYIEAPEGADLDVTGT